MTIPHPPPQERIHRQRIILRVSVLTALAASFVAILLWIGILPRLSGTAEPSGSQPPAAACPTCAPCPAPLPTVPGVTTATAPPAAATPEPAPPASTTSSPSEALRRFLVCEAPLGEPRVQILSIPPAASPVIGVHCGTSVHVIAIDRGEPRRIWRLELGRSGTPAAKGGDDRAWTDRAGDLLATDLNGDGAVDLIVGTVRYDEHGSPRSGVLLSTLRSSTGSFDAPRLIAPLSVAAMVATELDAAPGGDLAIARMEDSRLARGNELLLLRGGPAPVKLITLPAGVGVDLLGAADLDLDGQSDLILAGRARGTELVFLEAGGRPKRRVALDALRASAVLIGDLNGDGKPDVLLPGAEPSAILASAENSGVVRSLPSLRDLENVRIADWNGDGKLDVFGIRAHALVALMLRDNLEFESHVITPWLDQEFELRGAVSGRVYGDPSGLVLIASPVRARGRAELLLTKVVPDDLSSTRTEMVPDAPLCQHLSMP